MPVNRVFTENIKRQVPIHDRTEDTTVNTEDHGGAHQMLRVGSTHRELYLYIRDNPDCRRVDACEYVNCDPSRVTELLNEGLVYVTATKYDDVGNGHKRKYTTLRVVEGGSIGRARDLIKIEVRVLVNDFGEYSCEAKVVNQKPGARDGRRVELSTHTLPIRVPRPRENIKSRITHDVTADSKIIDIKPLSVVIDQ